MNTLTLAGLLAGALTLTACGGADDPTTTSQTRPGAGDTAQTAEVTDADVTFVAGMRPHHEQAVEMAEMILAIDPSPQIRTLAEQIRAEQQPEIELLDRMMDRFGADASGGHGGHSGGDMAMHGGSMSGEQMSALQQATGTDAERLFLQRMIDHHRGAIEAADAELRDGRDSEARDLAASIRASQQAEIEQLQRLLQQL